MSVGQEEKAWTSGDLRIHFSGDPLFRKLSIALIAVANGFIVSQARKPIRSGRRREVTSAPVFDAQEKGYLTAEAFR